MKTLKHQLKNDPCLDKRPLTRERILIYINNWLAEKHKESTNYVGLFELGKRRMLEELLEETK